MIQFTLPDHLIAQYQAEQRDQSRLLAARRDSCSLTHHRFLDLADLLDPGDLLILNDTQVIPARLYGVRDRTGGKWEGLFLSQTENGHWRLLCQTRGKLTEGETITVSPGPMQLRLIDKQENGVWLFLPSEHGDAYSILDRYGHVPLPPYIRKGQDEPIDVSTYQTVFARHPGAVAAPTAGLHFTEEVFARLRTRNISWRYVTLHVGWGTFQPIKTDNLSDHVMHSEWGELKEETVASIQDCRRRGNRVIAVGTTSVRVLESAALDGELNPWSGETNLFIRPPFEFRAVDALVTNFHLPQTTLLLLVEAFAGEALLVKAYREAIEREYRFYSYGDAMLVL